MGIEIVGVEGRAVPIIVCDHCGSRIRNGDGNAAYRYTNATTVNLEGPHFIHKACTDAWERVHDDLEDEMWLMDELDVWLGYLVRNAGYDLKDLPDALELADYLSEALE
jgi:hypothetical protein